MSPETEKILFQEAMAVQNASNLCGVAQTFARRIKDLLHDTRNTSETNLHLVVTLWLDKMVSLNQYDFGKVGAAYSKAFEVTKHD